jgi:cell division protein FtsI (penicillin-binding protein 3)
LLIWKEKSNGEYWEAVNYAVGESTVPGSTFKAASYMVALEDGKIKLSDTIDIKDGKTYYYGVRVEDSGDKYKGKITVKKAFEISSNVGVTRLIYNNYNGKESDFIKGLYKPGS